VQLGYITAERAPWIGAQIRAGKDLIAIFQGRSPGAGWLRVNFDGTAPILPSFAEKPRPRDDDGFWPDHIYDDD
jgi:hypothetical protein